MNKEQAFEYLRKANNNSPYYINWSEEGGAEVYRLNWDWFILFSVPQYGGESRYEGTYHINNLATLVDTAYSWT